MTQRFTLQQVRTQTYKDRDAWWTVWLVDPVAARLVRLVAPYRWISPNRLTMAAFVLGLAAATCFAQQRYPWLVAGAALFHLSFVIDCMDGKVARLTGTGSVFGAWLDYVFDRLRVLVCTVTLMGGQFARTGELRYVWAGGAVIFLDMFRYLNALQMGKVKNDMRNRLAAVHGEGAPRPVFVEQAVTLQPLGPADPADLALAQQPVVDVYGDFRTRFRLFVRFRNALVRQRIRAHVVSGIEFQMAVFIIGPLTGWIVGCTAVAGVLLATFELLLIFKLWTATRSFVRHLAAAVAEAGSSSPAGTASAGMTAADAVPVGVAAAGDGPFGSDRPGQRVGAQAGAGAVESSVRPSAP